MGGLCRELIRHLKRAAPGHLGATAMPPPVAQQVLSSMQVHSLLPRLLLIRSSQLALQARTLLMLS